MRLKGKVALITGGNSGIGRGIVHRFIDEGARVAFAGRDEQKGAAVMAEVKQRGGEGQFYAVDLAQERAVASMVDSVAQRFGGIDIVVNNAGVGSRRSGIEPDDAPGKRWDKMRGPNLDAAYFTSAYAMPMLARSGKGAIVSVSSTATLHGNWGLYCVAKAAIEGLTRSLAAEGAAHGIRANGVSPGWIATENDAEEPPSGNASGKWETPCALLNRMGVPAEIAGAVLFLASDDASFVTGQTLIVDGGLSITDYTSLAMLKKIGNKLFSGRV
jgi:NAD(P)-dependent dehydrogenase (short-subunit alcohol dehydrogenase family)